MLDLELNLTEVNNLLTVYDITGKEIQTLLPRKLSQGKHLLKWNANNLTSGLLFHYDSIWEHKENKKSKYI